LLGYLLAWRCSRSSRGAFGSVLRRRTDYFSTAKPLGASRSANLEYLKKVSDRTGTRHRDGGERGRVRRAEGEAAAEQVEAGLLGLGGVFGRRGGERASETRLARLLARLEVLAQLAQSVRVGLATADGFLQQRHRGEALRNHLLLFDRWQRGEDFPLRFAGAVSLH
jgi:hypothetical protein